MSEPFWIIPIWMRISRTRREGNHIVVDVRINRWHPGFWWYCYSSLRERGYSRGVIRAIVRSIVTGTEQKTAEFPHD